MTIHNEYFIKVKQPEDYIGLFENIEGLTVKETIQPSEFLSVDNNILTAVNNENSRVFVSKDICGSINSEASMPSSSVPLSTKYYYLYKIGGEYKFLKEKPYKNILFKDEVLLSLHDKNYSFLVDAGYEDFIQTSVETLPQAIDGNIYKCFSFNYGGISKSSASFYAISGSTIRLINLSDPDVIIDYVEGNLYLQSNGFYYETIIGLFNVDPIIIDNKGNVELEETESSFFKFINNSDKGNINIQYVKGPENRTLVSCTKNMYVFSSENGVRVVIDGVPLKSDYKLFVPKNTIIVVTGEYDNNSDIPIEDSYVSNMEDVYINSSEYSSTISSDFLYNGSVIPKTTNNYLYIVQEVEKNTYNFDKPSVIELDYAVIPQ